VPYEERIAKLEELEYPKPCRDFIYNTFNAFSDAAHPWVGQDNIRPKSIAREMFENFRSFADYIGDYDLHRAEGVLLRHLSSSAQKCWRRPCLTPQDRARAGNGSLARWRAAWHGLQPAG
jgi:hypothetical protein